MDEQLFDRRLLSWLESGPTQAAGWVTEAVLDHARGHPRRGSFRVRWDNAMKAVTTRTGPTAAFRPVLMMVIAALLLTLAGAGYLAWRQNAIVPPVPTPSPSPSAPPSLAAIFACPPGTDPDQPGPPDQA